MAETTTSASAATPDRRKLVVIVYTDMVGCSGLIGLDDQRTLERLCTLRRTLIDPAIGQHGDRIVQTGGDSLLIVFDSIDGAVRCAVVVQQQVPWIHGPAPPLTTSMTAALDRGERASRTARSRQTMR